MNKWKILLIGLPLLLAASLGAGLAWAGDRTDAPGVGSEEPPGKPPPVRSDDDVDRGECSLVHNIDACASHPPPGTSQPPEPLPCDPGLVDGCTVSYPPPGLDATDRFQGEPPIADAHQSVAIVCSEDVAVAGAGGLVLHPAPPPDAERPPEIEPCAPSADPTAGPGPKARQLIGETVVSRVGSSGRRMASWALWLTSVPQSSR